MKRSSLVLRTLVYFWQTNLAVMLGVAIGTAVIAGALIVGDSVRYSLRQMTFDRLAGVDYALSGSRFFREELASQFEKKGPILANAVPADKNRKTVVAPAILVTGTIRYERPGEKKEGKISVAGRVNLIGCDERLWGLLRGNNESLPDENGIVLNQRVAQQLGVEVGEQVSLYVKVPSTIPQESLLGKRDLDELTIEIPLTVSSIVESKKTLGRFSLQPSQQLPLNAYVNLDRLQAELGLDEQPASRRNRIAKPARVNALLISEPYPTNRDAAFAQDLASRPNGILHQLLSLDDLHLRLIESPDRKYFSLESQRMILEGAVSQLAEKGAAEIGSNSSPVLVYLVNEISNAKNSKKYSMYGIAAGVDLEETAPFGPFQDVQGNAVKQLQAGEVAINEWLAKDLDAVVGDEIRIKYHVVGSRGDLPELEKKFRVGAILKLEGTPADDPGLTPFVEGITDAKTFADWEQPFLMDLARITIRDEEYWLKYKATPKLFLNLKQARELWQSRYGDTTSVRIAQKNGQDLQQTEDEFRKQFLQDLPVSQLGLTILPVKYQGLQAAQGTLDFTVLFIAFSFFVIAAAAVLITLLFRLGIETRVRQIGLFSAIGFSSRKIQQILLAEGLLVAIFGSLLGLFLAVLYGSIMIYGLKTWWIGAIGSTFLQVDIKPASLVMGAVISLAVAVPGMWLGIRQMLKISPKDRLHGVMSVQRTRQDQQQITRGRLWLGGTLLAIAILSMLGVILKVIPASEAFGGFNWRIVSFFVAGISSLAGILTLYTVMLRLIRKRELRGQGITAAFVMGVRNTNRNRQRSGVTVALVSFATFVVIAVAAGKQNPTRKLPEFHSGNGGFSLVAESARALLYDLTSEQGQQKLGLNATEDKPIRELLSEIKMVSFRVRQGEDASCLNLYQTRLPTILGVPDEMITRGGFLFADTPGDNPWELLRGKTKAGHIPVMGDMDSLQYSLHKAIGDTIDLPEELQRTEKLEVVGSLGGSVFQGVLLMSQKNFQNLFPDISGYNYFLIECDPSQNEQISRILETRLVTLGFDVEPIGERLENYLAVQNTYLSTFQALGGLGLLLGTFGLGTVMLRNVLERRSELALMRAIGFSKMMLAVMVLAENAWLLLLGLSIGTVCALISMTPQILSRAADVPWDSGAALLIGVFITGMLSALLAVAEAVRTPVLETLRSE